jgi:hypothetical protein
MKDVWKRVYLLYPKAVTEVENYVEGQMTSGFFYTLGEAPPAMQIGMVLQFLSDNEWVHPNEITAELFAPSGDFVDNGFAVIEEILETLENRI